MLQNSNIIDIITKFKNLKYENKKGWTNKMNSKLEKTQNKNEVKLEITIAKDEFNNGIKQAYFKNAKYFAIPGFRKGKAPQNIIERQYGEEIFYDEAFNIVAPDAYDAAIKEHNLEVVSKPEIDITQIGKDKDLIFTAVVQVKPDVELGDYKGIELKKVEYKVTAKNVEEKLNEMAEKNSRLVEVTDREVKDGDTTVIDFEGFVDGTAFEGGKAQGHSLEIGSKTFIPGFEDQIIGMKKDEEKDINVKFPEEYFSKELAGKDAVFKVKLHEIKEKQIPEINDDFAKDVSEFDTLEELKNSIKDKLKEENKNKAKYETEDAAIKLVVENAKVDIPSGMLDMEIDNMMHDLEHRLQYQGLKLDDYLMMVGKTQGEFRKEYEEQATTSIKTRLVLEKIAEIEKIEADDKKLDEKLQEMASMYGKTVEDMKANEKILEYVKAGLKREETIEFLTKNANLK